MFRCLISLLASLTLFASGSFSAVEDLDPSVVQDAVQKLADLGIINDSQYWLDNAKKGKAVPSSTMGELVIAAAGKFEQPNTIEEAVDILCREKILTDQERWKRQLVDKSSFPGADAAFLITVFAQKIN